MAKTATRKGVVADNGRAKSKKNAKPAKAPAATQSTPKKHPVPVKFSKALMLRICEQVMAGFTVRQICDMPKMPQKAALFHWLAHNEDFKAAYTAAKEIQMDVMAEEMMDIADDGTNDWIERENLKTGATYTVFNVENYNRSRLRVETRKWLMMALRPKKYGTKVTNEVVGAEGGPVQIDHHAPRALEALAAFTAKLKQITGASLVELGHDHKLVSTQ